jgi:hypothetical protein
MQDARTSRRDAARTRRSHAGVVASYLHELSERHDDQRREARRTDESRPRRRSLTAHALQVQPCEGA